MENNPELERAERELENELLEERIREKQKYSLSDYLLIFSALVYFLFGIISPFILIILLIGRMDSSRISFGYFCLILLAGPVSLGTGIGLFRIFDLSRPLEKQMKT